MADEEHVKILRRGVDAWNQWRKVRLRARPDLSRANLYKGNFSGADLSGADLIGANLNRANLREANLREADLTVADLTVADLTGADLTGADLNGTDLSGAILTGAILRKVQHGAADLVEADLTGADLTGADLNGANLTGASCQRANFSNADLSLARLVEVMFDGTTLTGAHLWETQRAGWSIKGVICESAYLEEDKLSAFAPGEFERLYSDRTKIVLFYQGGLSPLEFSALPALVKHLEESRPGCTLRLGSITDGAGGAVVTLVIDSAGDGSREGLQQLKADLEKKAKQAIKYQRKALAERETRLQLEGEVKQLSAVVDKLILRPNLSLHSQGGIRMGDEYNVGQAGAAGPQSHAHDMTFNQIGGNIERAMKLSQLAGELATLREAMSREAAVAGHYIAVGKVAEAEEAAKAKDSSKVAESLKAAGKWALDVATKIGTTLASEALKESMGLK